MNKRQGSRYVRKSPLRTREHATASKGSGRKPHNQKSRKFQPAKNRGVPTLANEEPDSESDPEDDSEDKEDADVESKPDEDCSSGTMLRHRKQQGGRYIRKKNVVQRTPSAKQVDIEKSPPVKEVKFLAPAELGAQKAFRSDTPTEDYILSFGLSKVGFDEKRQRRVSRHLSIRRFNAFYGVPPVTVRAIFNDLKADCPSATLHYLLLALNWLKLYSTEPVLSGRWKHCDEHIRKMTKEYARMMQSLMETKITFDGFDPKEIYWISVDTVSFRTQEFRLDPSADWYDFKSNSSGLKYEFACALRRPEIVWVNGPKPCGLSSDSTMFRGGKKDDDEGDLDTTALYHMLPKGKKAIGDSGYEGMPEKVTITRDGQSDDLKQFLGRAKNRQESLHTRLKSFNCLYHRFRHGKSTQNKMELHKMCVEAVCVIVQYDMENGSPIFDL